MSDQSLFLNSAWTDLLLRTSCSISTQAVHQSARKSTTDHFPGGFLSHVVASTGGVAPWPGNNMRTPGTKKKSDPPMRSALPKYFAIGEKRPNCTRLCNRK